MPNKVRFAVLRSALPSNDLLLQLLLADSAICMLADVAYDDKSKPLREAPRCLEPCRYRPPPGGERSARREALTLTSSTSTCQDNFFATEDWRVCARNRKRSSRRRSVLDAAKSEQDDFECGYRTSQKTSGQATSSCLTEEGDSCSADQTIVGVF